MPFLTYDPLPQCLQPSPLTPLLLARGHQRGSRRYLSDVKYLHTCLAVTDEDVDGAVGVVRHEIGGSRGEGDEAPIGRDRRDSALAVTLNPARRDAHQLGAAGPGRQSGRR